MTPTDTIRTTAAPRTGWLRLSAEAWPAIAAALPLPWPAEAAGTDLGWWRDQLAQGRVARIPSHRALAARWGWTEWQARRALQQLGPQGATENREKTERRPSVAPQESQVSHYDPAGMSRLDEEDRERAETAPPAAPEADAEVERRVAARLAEQAEEERIAAGTRRAIAAGSVELQAARVELEARAGRPLEPAEISALRARMSRAQGGCASAEDVLLVDKWTRESPHREAAFLREIGASVRTVLNERFGWRLERAREWAAGADQREQPRAQQARQGGQPSALLRTMQGVAAIHATEQRQRAEPAPPRAQLEERRERAPVLELSLEEQFARFSRGEAW